MILLNGSILIVKTVHIAVGLVRIEEGTISVSIIKSMSHQVWIKVDLSKVQILRKYDFTK